MASWTPDNYIELIKALFYGVAIICVPFATVYIMITANRVKDLGNNVDRLEKNTNSISERNQAIAMKLGITEGIAQERASVQANASTTLPLPVTDEKTAEKLDKVVEAIQDQSSLSQKI